MQVVLITPPPIWEKSLMDRNRVKGKSLYLDRTNTRHSKHYYYTYMYCTTFMSSMIFDISVLCRTLLYVNACKDVGREVSCYISIHFTLVHTQISLHTSTQYTYTIASQQHTACILPKNILQMFKPFLELWKIFSTSIVTMLYGFYR